MGVCNCSMFCCTLLYVHSSIATILMGKRELVALLILSSWCLKMVERLIYAASNKGNTIFCFQFCIYEFVLKCICIENYYGKITHILCKNLHHSGFFTGSVVFKSKRHSFFFRVICFNIFPLELYYLRLKTKQQKLHKGPMEFHNQYFFVCLFV